MGQSADDENAKSAELAKKLSNPVASLISVPIQNTGTSASARPMLYVGPSAPAGFEKNWIPSVAGKAWFAYFRLYGPLETYFDKSWPLPDFEKVK